MNTLKINGTTLTGIYVDAAVSFNKPAKRVQTFSVPGRNGDLIIDEGTFDNVLITYPVYEKSTFPAEFDDLVNWLASLEGYQRIECSNDPGHYRLGRFVVPQTPTAKRLNKDGYYTLSFDCKPQRYLISGETPLEITSDVVTITSDNEPYNFRVTAGSKHADLGDSDVETDTLVGGSLAWNQLAPVLAQGAYILQNASYMSDVAFGSNSLTFKVATPSGWVGFAKTNVIVQNHKYLQSCYITAPTGIQFTSSPSNTGASGFSEANKRTLCSAVWAGTSSTTLVFYLKCQNLSVGDTVVADTPQVIDLTQMFGSTIADYIYSLETAEAGKGVAWFKKLFPKPYYAYNAGELIHVNASAHKMVGFNAWDEQGELGGVSNQTGADYGANDRIRTKNYVPILPNTTYYIKTPKVLGTVAFYDASKNFISALSNFAGNTTTTTPANAYFMRFCMTDAYGTTYKNDICINLHWDGERDGEYEPYEVHNYALDSDLVLRGIPKLDSANRLYYDGDTYESDGTVTRKYGIVDLGSLTWDVSSYGDIFTATLNNMPNYNSLVTPNMISSVYKVVPTAWYAGLANMPDKSFTARVGSSYLQIRDSAYSDGATFKTAVTGQKLVYELATPTEETADPYTNPQICSNWGTEEYVVTEQSGVAMPVGHESDYFDQRGYLIVNPTHFTSKPITRVFGIGTFRIGDVYVTIASHDKPYIDIDTEMQDCYYESTNMNSYVTFSGGEYPVLDAGNNYVMPTPGITKFDVTPRWWEL